MNFIIAPLVNIIGRFKLVWRFTFLTALVALSLIYLSSNIILKQMESRATTALELKGIEVIIPVINILDSIQDLRSLSVVAQVTPSAVKQSQLDELTAAVDKNFTNLNEIIRVNAELDVQSHYDELFNGWTKVKSKQGDVNQDAFHLYDDYLDTPKTFLKFVTSQSQLALEADSDLYYFIQMVGMQLPELLESYTMIRDLTYKALGKKELTEDTASYIGYSLAIFEQNMDLLENDISFISSHEQKLTSEIQRVVNSLKASDVRKFEEDHVLSKKYDADAVAFNDKALAEATAAFGIFDTIAREVQSQLRDRLTALRNQIISQSLACLFVIAFIGLVFVAFYISTNNSLKLAADAANDIAEGKLSGTIDTECKDDFKILFDAFTAMQANLREIVGDINDVSHTVNGSAREISSGNSNLSERTQEQASALVETAASLNNLTDTVKKNADSARDATTLADKSSNIAEQGRDAVGKVLVTMSEINDSAEKIQEITSVIDSIAFQTNLLALNASVEAARAGEQGRGFAVVASEVRNLAQRSSDAAKQIKQLINDSMSKVEAGDRQVKLTADTMQEILESITQVNDIVKLISIASAEQSNGIEQINIVVSGMEDSTQKNAALVEEAAASAELLEKQSNKLVEVMNRFDV